MEMKEPKYFIPPNVGQMVPLLGNALLLSSVDLSKMTGTFTIHENEVAARLALHELSKSQNPQWHADNCKYCRTGWGL